MPLIFNHSALITVDGAATLDINTASSLPQSHCDLAVVGIGDFVSGNYTQKSGDVNDIVSNFTLSSTSVQGAGFYLSTAPVGVTLSTFGNAVTATSTSLEIKQRKLIGNFDVGEDKDWFANLQTMDGNRSLVSTVTALKTGGDNGGAGAVLVQAAASALFKALGKHAALNNDKAISSKQVKMSNDMSNAWKETDASYNDSDIFKRYLDSGRYADDGADVNTVVNYNLVSTSYDFIVQLSGNVTDSSDPNTDLDIARILGNSAAGETKVLENGDYKFNVYMRLQHQASIAQAV